MFYTKISKVGSKFWRWEGYILHALFRGGHEMFTSYFDANLKNPKCCGTKNSCKMYLWTYFVFDRTLLHQGFLEAPAHNLDQQHNSFNNSGHVLQLLKPETPTFLLLFSKYFCSSKLHSYIFKKSVSSNCASVTCPKADGLAHVCVPSRFFLSNSSFAFSTTASVQGVGGYIIVSCPNMMSKEQRNIALRHARYISFFK